MKGEAELTLRPLTISVVSHGHDSWLPGVLRQLAANDDGLIAEVIVTHNLPTTELLSVDGSWPFTLTQLTNARPQGFGTNHNQALARAETALVCVLNPDMSFPDVRLWPMLVAAAHAPGIGCAFPVLLNPDGTVQDNARAVPTPLALFRRRVQGREDARVDWASAALWVVPREIFRKLGGFDQSYFMYCEDVDFCLRMQSAGFRLVQVDAHAIHHAQRSSHRRWNHLAWHVRSLVHLWTGRALWAYLRRPPSQRPLG